MNTTDIVLDTRDIVKSCEILMKKEYDFEFPDEDTRRNFIKYCHEMLYSDNPKPGDYPTEEYFRPLFKEYVESDWTDRVHQLDG